MIKPDATSKGYTGAILDQIIKKLKDMALREMDVVLKKYGGGAKNPKATKKATTRY